MKKALITSLFIAFCFTSFSQKARLAIKVLKESRSEYSISQDEALLEEFVINKFVNANKFKIIDRSFVKDIQSEQDLSGKLPEEIGADLFIVIRVSNLEITRSTSGSTYICKLNYTLKVLDIATSEIANQEIFEGQAGSALDPFGPTTPGKALSKAQGKTEKKVESFIQTLKFNPAMSITDVDEKDGNGNPQKLVIDIGSSGNAKVGDKYKVVELIVTKTPDGNKTRKKEIAQVEITKVEDENFSICTVTSGAEELGKKITRKEKLRVTPL